MLQKLQDRCEICQKIAITKSSREIKLGSKRRLITTLECGHTTIKDADSTSPFDEIVFDGDLNCKHEWNRTGCINCNAKRLFEYQVEGARAIEKHNGNFAIFDEMGLGKTIQALAYLKFHPEMWPFLWVTKSGTMFQHGKEIVRVLGPNAAPWMMQSAKDKPIRGMNCVCSYDLFRRLKPELFDQFKIVILDECQAIKNPDSSRTAAIRQMIKGAPILDLNGKITGYNHKKVIPLSGTPWKNRGSEFFVVLNMLDPKMFGNFAKFKENEVDYYYEGAREKEGGLLNPDKFLERISHIAIRRERKDVMPELPLINRTELLCELPEYARAIYKQEEDKLLTQMTDFIMEGESSFSGQAEIQQTLMVMKQIVGIAKVDTTCEKVEEFLEETDRKLVVFVHHKKCMEMIHNRLKTYCAENNIAQPLLLSAALSPGERFEVAEKFNRTSKVVMIASTLAAGEGLNLQTCSDCIIHERQWNPANEEQAEGRFIRIGQTAQSVNAIYVHGENTVDSIFHTLVERKRIFISSAMNKEGYSSNWSESSLISELLTKIKEQRKK